MIRITRQVDYGILLLVRFAAGGGQESLTARDLARETGLPLPMVSKILKTLAREGLLVSQRGVKGGYRMLRRSHRISIAEVIRALDGPIAITQCIDEREGDCALERLCPVSWRWQTINGAIQEALRGITLADMCRAPGPARRRPGSIALEPTGALGAPS